MSRTGVSIGVGLLSAVAVGVLVLPLVALGLAAPWSDLPTVLTDPVVTAALRLSLLASVAALTLSMLLGIPLAWLLARREFRGQQVLRAVCILPMVLPPVVGGVALLLTFGRRGVIGGPLATVTGLTIPFSLAAVVLAAAFVSMPFLVVSVEAGLRSLDARYEEAAATLGASRWRVFRRVTLPLLGPSLAAGMALTWTRALGEFGATITFAGNLPGRTQTLPLAVYLELETNPEGSYLMSLALLAVSAAVLLALRGRYLQSR